MRLVYGSALALALCAYLVPGIGAQPQAAQGGQDERSRAIAGGGISAPGWTGFVHPSREDQGLTLNDAKLTQSGTTMQVTTGPAVTYWNPANTASGNYTVKATFTEPQFMNVNNHAHPYGLFIAGNDMGTEQQSYLYCAAYGDRNRFIVRGFGPEPFQMNGRGGSNPAVRAAAGRGQSVSQEIAMSVDADSVDCSINGTVVASYPKAEVVAPGKLKSTDGIFGFRFGHNTEGTVSGLSMTKN
jgi:hypothetical protein